MSKAQISIEYIMIVLFISVAVMGGIYVIYSTFESQKVQIQQNQVGELATEMIEMAEKVYYQGGGSRVTIQKLLPEGVREISIENSDEGSELVFKHGTSDQVSELSFPSNIDIIGYFPPESTTEGLKQIRIEAVDEPKPHVIIVVTSSSSPLQIHHFPTNPIIDENIGIVASSSLSSIPNLNIFLDDLINPVVTCPVSPCVHSVSFATTGTHQYYSTITDTQGAIIARDPASGTKNFAVSLPNSGPTLSSVSDAPDPQNSGGQVAFDSIATDPDTGDQLKLYICKDSSCTNCNPVVTTNCWSISSPQQVNPSTQYSCPASGSPTGAGPTSYWAQVCDAQAACSSVLPMQTFTCALSDTTPPTTSYSLSGNTVTLTCSDSGSGCQNTLYCTDTTNTCAPTTTYSAPFTVSGTGYARYYSTDIALNVETTQSSTYDLSAPVLSNGQPTGTITTSATTLSATTDKTATCKYDLAPATYDAMTYTFTTTGGTSHSQPLSGLSDGVHNYYVRCRAASGSTNNADYVITFTVNTNTPPTINSISDTPDPQTGGSAILFSSSVNDPEGQTQTLYVFTDAAGTAQLTSSATQAQNPTASYTCPASGAPTGSGPQSYWAKVYDGQAFSPLVSGGTFTCEPPNSPPTITAATVLSGDCSAGSTLTISCDATDTQQPSSTLSVNLWAGQCTTENCFATRSWTTGTGMTYHNPSSMTYTSGNKFTKSLVVNQPVGTSIAATCQSIDSQSATSGWGDAYPICTVGGCVSPPTFSSITANPNPAKLGTVTITFTSSKTLSANPTVLIRPQGSATDYAATYVSNNGLNYVYQFTVTASHAEGLAEIQIRGTDAQNCAGSSIGTFTIDRTAPATSVASVEGDSTSPYVDNSNNGQTVIIVNGEAGMTCRWSSGDAAYSDTWGNSCTTSGTQATCTINDGNTATNIGCKDAAGNGQTALQNLNVGWSMGCTATAASFTLTDSNGNTKADTGESISMSATISGDCSAVNYFQIDASGEGCNIAYSGGSISGISSGALTKTASSITATWAIPAIPAACDSKTVTGTAATLRIGAPGISSTIVGNMVTPTGSFTFKTIDADTLDGMHWSDMKEYIDARFIN